MKEYKITKSNCESLIFGVCCRCGGKLEPIETVDNAGDPTYWSGCLKCGCFDKGVTSKVYAIAKIMVTERRYKPYSWYQNNHKDTEEEKQYKVEQNIGGTCGFVGEILRIAEMMGEN